MKAGYVYVLQNPAFGPYVVKIGETSDTPVARAQSVYYGATGVPTPFFVYCAYTVGDRKLAEKRVHKRLKAFRMNNRREFFRAAPEVAEALVLEVCTEINSHLGLPCPVAFTVPSNPSVTVAGAGRKRGKLQSEDPEEPSVKTSKVRLADIRPSAIGTSTLTEEQQDRVCVLQMQLFNALPGERSEWLHDFSRDTNPEREIRIWESLAKAYLSIEELPIATDDLKREAFSLLLQRTMASTDEVLAEAELQNFCSKTAKRLLELYELRPKPLSVVFR